MTVTPADSSTEQKILRSSSEHQITLSQQFLNQSGFGAEAECMLDGDSVRLRPLSPLPDRELAEQILEDLAARDDTGDELFQQVRIAQQQACPDTKDSTAQAAPLTAGTPAGNSPDESCSGEEEALSMGPIAQGRPAIGSREPVEERCYDFLDGLKIPYARVDHASAGTMEDLLPVEGALGCRIAKNLFLCNRQQTEFYLLLMPGDKPFKTKYLSGQLGCSRLSFASEEALGKLLGVTPGSASVLGLMNDRERRVRLLIDQDLETWEGFGCHPCRNTASLRLSFRDLRHKILPALGYEPTWVELPWELV